MSAGMYEGFIDVACFSIVGLYEYFVSGSLACMSALYARLFDDVYFFFLYLYNILLAIFCD